MQTHSIFITKVGSQEEKAAAQLLIDSIRAFGGEMRGCPVWIFAADSCTESCQSLAAPHVEIFHLSIPEHLKHYPFSDKVAACAKAEAMVPAEIDSLIWLDAGCLIVQPPLLYALGNDFDAALRPVHHRNIGLPIMEPLNSFWQGIYEALGIQDMQFATESFIDHQCLRAYFNSHGFSLRPSLGLAQRWAELFETLASNRRFQEHACTDERYRIFLFQALLSSLIASSVDWRRIRILPPTYNYPYNLQSRIEKAQRAEVLNELVSLTFEGRAIHPDSVTDIEIHEPLRAWLKDRVHEIFGPAHDRM